MAWDHWNNHQEEVHEKLLLHLSKLVASKKSNNVHSTFFYFFYIKVHFDSGGIAVYLRHCPRIL